MEGGPTTSPDELPTNSGNAPTTSTRDYVSSQCSSSITTSVWALAYHRIDRQHDTNTRESAPTGFPTPSFRAYQQPGPDSSIPIVSITTTVTPFIPHLHKRRRYSMLDNILFPPTALPGPAFPSCELQLPISTQAHQPSVHPYFQRTYPDPNSDSPSTSVLQPAEVKVFKLTSNATKPTISPTVTGMELYSAYTYTVHS